MKPLVTLIVPTLNGSDTIQETVSSVLSQDFPSLDILISDNGSHDGTFALVKSLANSDPRVRFRRNEVTVPMHEHYNQCFEAARGEFLIALDDDDTISPNFVSALMTVAVRFPDVNVVVPRNVIIDEQGAITRELATPDGPVHDGAEFVCNWLYHRTPAMFASVGTVLARTATVRHFGGYQPFDRGRNIDNLLFLQCAITGCVGFAHDAVFKWRVYDRSYSASPSVSQLAAASLGFIRHLQRDARTNKALNGLPAGRRQEIIDGVRSMAAYELLRSTGFREKRFGLAKLRSAFVFPVHSMYYRLVFEHYWRRLRGLRRAAAADARG